MDKILPYILATVTRKPRYKVEGLVFPEKAWISCLFRLWELVFWRKVGIRREAASWIYSENGKVYEGVKFYTLEAALVHAEGVVRKFFKSWEFEFVRIPSLVLVTDTGNAFELPLMPHIKFAIAYGTSAGSYANGVTSRTVSLTTSGSDRFFTSNCGYDTPQSISSVTYNGTACSVVQSPQNGGGARTGAMYVLAAPSTGANNAVVNFSGATNGGLSVAYYTGVKQTGQPYTSAAGSTSSTSHTATVTAVGTLSWLIAIDRNDLGAPTPGSGTTLRISNPFDMWDSNGAVGSGSQSLAWSSGGSFTSGYVIGAIQDATYSDSFIKTINGLPKASVKTVNGLAIASVKSWLGLA